MRLSRRNFLVLGLLVAVGLAIFVSPFASSSPDGLEKVAADKGIDADAKPHALADGPLADYGVAGIDDERVSTGLSGLVGVVLVFAVCLGGFGLLRVVRSKVKPSAPQTRDGTVSPRG